VGVILTKKNEGKQFEIDVENSCKDQSVFYFRVRDVMLPPDVRMRVKLPQNKYDCLLFYKNHLFPVEQKSTKSKSISFSESIIKQHQIDNLVEAATYPDVIAGFLFNFREPNNRTFFVDIHKFVEYKNIAENELEHTYESKVNKASIPIDICEEIGIEVTSVRKKVHMRHYINKLLDVLIENKV
jgi:penicillin-binding protein-related factor A (putative recombinase)